MSQQATRTPRAGGKHAAARGGPDRGGRARGRLAQLWRAQPWRPRSGRSSRAHRIEVAGLAAGLIGGLCASLVWLIPGSPHRSAPAAAASGSPVVVRGSPAQPDPAALDAQWTAYSDRSGCADWAGGDGVSAIRLNSSQLAWFFSDTYLGPAGPATGFSRISGFVNNSMVIQTTTGRSSTFVTMTGGGACRGPGGSTGLAAPVVAPPQAPGSPDDRYWDEDGITIGGTVVKFYNRYLPGGIPFIPAGTVIAAFPVGQLSAAGRGSAYGAVARPELIPLPSYTPPDGGAPVVWGASLLRAGNMVYVYGTQSPGSSARQLYLARVRAPELTRFGAWQFYAGPGHWTASQQQAQPVQPPGRSLPVSTGFSVVGIGHRYWLIQAGAQAGSPDIDAYPASEPWGPFDPAAGILLYRNPDIGLDPAHDYLIMYEARAEPALSTGRTLVISYNVNSAAVTRGCMPLSALTNTVTQPRFITVPLAAFGDPGGGAPARAGPSGYPRIVPRDPSQWFNAWDYADGCPPVPGLAAVQARPAAGQVTLNWPDAGLGLRYQVYLQGPGGTRVSTAYSDRATITGLPPGGYQARVVPVNRRQDDGPSAEVTFTVP